MKISVLKSRLSVGFHRVALVEADEHFSAKIASYAEDLAMGEVTLCTNADEYLQVGPDRFDLVILDWNVKGTTSGLTLFNRLRHDPRYSMLPILIISGFVDRNDFRLLEEFPLTRLVEKPFTSGVFIEAIQSLQDELNWIHSHEKSIRKLIVGPQTIDSSRFKKLHQLLQGAPYPAPLLLMLGRFLSCEKRWDEAEKLLRSVVSEDSGNVLALNELGKVLHASGRHREAMDVLEKANTLSPDNVKRICQLGELHLHECDLKTAQKNFEKALAVDPHWARAKKGAELTTNVINFLQQSSHSDPFPKSFASLMNTMGISKVHGGHLEEGIHHYESALHFIRDVDTRSKVMFNMGLGYLRFRLGDKALLWFMRSAKTGGKQFPKAHTYVQDLSSKLVWTDHGLKVQGQTMIEVDAHDDHPVQEAPTPWQPKDPVVTETLSFTSDGSVSKLNEPMPGLIQLEDFDNDALLSGVVEEGFC